MPLDRCALLVVTSPGLRTSLASALAAEGLPADVVGDAAAAEALLAVRRYDAVIAELNPGDPDGPRVLSALACRADRPVFVVLSPGADPRLVRCVAALRPDEIALPPVDPAAVAAKTAWLVVAFASSAEPGRDSIPAKALAPNSLPQAEPAQPAAEPVAASPARPGTADASTAKTVVAIRLADRERSRELASRLGNDAVAAVRCDTADELHELLSRDRVDLLVIDNHLPGFLTGLDVLEMFHKELIRPDAILLTDRRERDARRISALQPAQVLPAGSDSDEIAEAVRAVLARRRSAGLLVSAAARRFVAECETVKPMPQLLVRLVGYLAMDAAEIPVPELTRDVTADPKATAELLRLANTSAVARRRRVTGVTEAVTLLGPRRIVSLFLSGAAVASAGDLLRNWSEPMQAWYHRRGVLTAAAAQAFARLEGVSPDTAFLLGLLQDLGSPSSPTPAATATCGWSSGPAPCRNFGSTASNRRSSAAPTPTSRRRCCCGGSCRPRSSGRSSRTTATNPTSPAFQRRSEGSSGRCGSARRSPTSPTGSRRSGGRR